MLPQLIFSLPLTSSQQAGDGIYVSVMFGTSVSLVMRVMCYALQLSLFVNVLLSGSLYSSYCYRSVFSFSLVYDPTNSSMDTTAFFHQCFQYDSGKHIYEKQPALEMKVMDAPSSAGPRPCPPLVPAASRRIAVSWSLET